MRFLGRFTWSQGRGHLEAEQHLVLVGEVTDDAAQRGRQPFDQGGRRENAVVLGGLRILENVDDLQRILAVQIILADSLEVSDGRFRPCARSSDVEFQ
jgi:hypothetical protein